MTLPTRITSARNEFVVRYGQYPNAIIVGPNAELELGELIAEMERTGFIAPSPTARRDLLGMRIFTSSDPQDFVVCLIHDHTV